MKKVFLVLLVSTLILPMTTLGALGAPYGLGDLGKPDDYGKTLKRFKHTISQYETFVEQLPASLDWRDFGVVTPAGDQGSCGCCWAFASVGAFESKLLILGEPAVDLAEQQQISCNTFMAGCCGGSMSALRYWYDNGPLRETCASYGESQTSCPTQKTVNCPELNACSELGFNTTGYYTVDTGDLTEVKTSLYEDGPTYFRFNVYSDFYSFWNTAAPGTVYANEQGGDYRGGHAVLIIGWDDAKGAWLCKNSWGVTGGPNGDGTFWIAREGHNENLGFGMANVEVKSSDAFPDIKANNQDGNVTVSAGTPVAVTISLDPGADKGLNAEWWLGAVTGAGVFSCVFPIGWTPGISPFISLPLINVSSLPVFNQPLPTGIYAFYFALDRTIDGTAQPAFMDVVVVNVEP